MPDNDRLELQRDIGKLWRATSDLRTTLIGIDGTNGIRSRVVALETFKDETEENLAQLSSSIQHFLDTRKDTCLGLKELARRGEQVGEEVPVTVAKIKATAETKMQWIILIGVALSNLTTLLALIL